MYSENHVLQSFLSDANSRYSLRPRHAASLSQPKNQTTVIFEQNSCSLTFIELSFKSFYSWSTVVLSIVSYIIFPGCTGLCSDQLFNKALIECCQLCSPDDRLQFLH